MISASTGEDLAEQNDLSPSHELWLGQWAKNEHDSDFVFVLGYPSSKRPFYTHSDPGRPEFSLGFDLLFVALELVTGGKRLHHYDDYPVALRARGLPVEPYIGYLLAFKYGMPPHGGFAIGQSGRWRD